MKESNPIDELVHSLASPLNNVRLQLGLIRQNTAGKEHARVDSADREVQRAQAIVVAVAEVTSSGVRGNCKLSELAARLRVRWPEMDDADHEAVVVSLPADRAYIFSELLVEGCNSLTTESSAMLQLSGDIVIRIQGAFEQVKTTRALRLTHVDVDGSADLALAKARLMAMTAGGSLELGDGVLLVRLPVEGK